MKTPRLLSYFDAAALLTIVSGFMYFVGYMYHAAYYRYFGVDLAFFPRSGADYIVTAWEYAFWFIFAVLTLAFLRTAFADAVPPHWVAKVKSSLPGFFPALFGLVVFLVMMTAAARMEQRGLRDAKATADQKKVVRISTTSNLELPKELYLLSYSQGKYLLYYFPSPYARPNVIMVNDANVSKIEFPRLAPSDSPKS